MHSIRSGKLLRCFLAAATAGIYARFRRIERVHEEAMAVPAVISYPVSSSSLLHVITL